MKSWESIGALVVLAVMVFGITFAMNFLNTAKPPPPDTKMIEPVDNNLLTFYTKVLPDDPTDAMQYIYHESRKEGYLDFLFENPNDKDVTIGLIGKNCRCASVEVVLAPAEWKTRRALMAAAETVAELQFDDLLGSQLFAQLCVRALRPDQDSGLQKIQKRLKSVARLEPDQESETAVPAHSIGFIRLGWDNTKVGIDRFKGDLWIDNPHSGKTATLEAEVHFVAPAKAVSDDILVNELKEIALEKRPFEGAFVVWSPIRSELHLKAEVIHPPRYGDRVDPFVVEPPVPVSAEEIAKHKGSTFGASSVKCAYWIPFKLYGRSPRDWYWPVVEGKVAIDLGAFRRRVRVWSDVDEGVEPMELTVTGSVQGSVLIGDPQDQGRVSVGTFDSHVGSTAQGIVLTGKVPGVKLEVDEKRTSEFLRGSYLKPVGDVAGLPRWKLWVQVKPDAARGHFPRMDDALYHDSAVYLKVIGEVVQNVRVPVDGDANTQ